LNSEISPQQYVRHLTNEQLHEAIDKHYGTPTWDTDFKPHLTKEQHAVVKQQVQDADEQVGLIKKSKLTANDLHEAMNKHYGTPTWGSDIRPHLTADQQKTVQKNIQNIDEELEISNTRERSDVDKPTRLGVEKRPFLNRQNKLTKKRPDYTELHKLMANPTPELSEKQRALKLLTAKKRAEGSLMPKVGAYAEYHTNPKRIFKSAKNAVKSITGRKTNGPQNT
jgi:hypothetical protein